MTNIPAALVKELREKTGAGMMDCKKALEETGGDMDKAVDYLRKKGIAKAEKKASREVKDGLVEAYIHAGGKLGVLVEINCETDFVAKTKEFREFARNVAMQIAASNPLSVKREGVPQEVLSHEMEIYVAQAKESGKPDHIAEKIAQGKMDKFFAEKVLLEQAYIRNPEITVKDYLTEMISRLGENITIRQFSRFRIGDE
ncbi:MAG: translation elongation factor Ts [Calditrichaceae bacterium]|nr:translation elongation factor Ts [Calditrichia bacterium]NUQ41534.1 translation elongation factor Ts [Calditrichaceae bacterium]